MIKTELVKIPKTNDVSTEYVENELLKREIDPIRWAIVEVESENFVVSVSFDC